MSMPELRAARPVIVGIDGTASGLAALALAQRLAGLTGAELVLASVYGHELHAPEGPMWPTEGQVDEWLAEAELHLDGSASWRSCTVCATAVARGLSDLATREDAAMVVVGSTHRGRLGRVLAGSTAQQLLQGGPCSVAVVPHGWHPPTRIGVVGIAFTDAPEARAALETGNWLATCAGARLRVVTVVTPPPPAHPMFATTSYQHWVADLRHRGHALVDAAARDMAPGAETVVLEGVALERMTEASADLDLLVLGSRRYGPVRRVLLGGLSSLMIQRSACPVLVVPRGVDAPVGRFAASAGWTRA
jgi:nucleotide-binding universal stress UspA family protein